jgi:hypothetical protein
MQSKFDYFAAGAAVAAGVASVLLVVFLFFFTCFFATGAELPLAVAAVCAASDKPAAASVRESPSNTDVIFFMMIYPVLFSRRFVFSASIAIDGVSINPP